MQVSVTVKGQKEVNKALSSLVYQYPKDTARALNKTAQKSATGTRRQLAPAVGLAQKEIKSRVKYFKTNAKNLAASVWIGVKAGIPLSKVGGARMSLRGVIKAGKNNVQTFRARMPSGYVGSFVRKPGARHKERPDGQMSELPIEEPKIRLAEPGKPIIKRVTTEFMRSFFPKELQRLINRTNAQAAKRAKTRGRK